ncbi:LamG-like jellyroll fold domain-containing protein [Poriferisphaera sp. WC338]|uniref:LamG-like jellyroll fold domain-containing protein n=1 Tax=Poriferisphaera sp. WC338 TaxID=3425129 RepID=UPI003D81B5BF
MTKCGLMMVSVLALVGGSVSHGAATPPVTSKLFAAYDATDVSVTDSGGTLLVDSLNDQASGGGDASVADNAVAAGGLRPTLVTANTGNGNHSVIDFDGSQTLATAAFDGGEIGRTNTIFIVASRDSGPNSFLVDGISNGKRHAVFTRSNGTHAIFGGSQIINNGATASLGEFEVYTAIFSSSASQSQLRINGTKVVGSGNTGSDLLSGLQVGAQAGGGGSRLDGQIAEILVYNGGLNTAQIESIEGYLADKYINPVPEPMGTAVLGLGGLMLMRRR